MEEEKWRERRKKEQCGEEGRARKGKEVRGSEKNRGREKEEENIEVALPGMCIWSPASTQA